MEDFRGDQSDLNRASESNTSNQLRDSIWSDLYERTAYSPDSRRNQDQYTPRPANYDALAHLPTWYKSAGGNSSQPERAEQPVYRAPAPVPVPQGERQPAPRRPEADNTSRGRGRVIEIEDHTGILDRQRRDGRAEELPKPTDRLPQDRPAEPQRASDQLLGFPPRRDNLPSGSQFYAQVLGVSQNDDPRQKGVMGVQREQAILRQIELGNIPDFMRQPKQVTIRDKQGNTAQLFVMPDYVAIGSNEDYVRVPMTPVLAKTIAEKYGMALPTKKVVDAVYQQADIKLAGQGLVQNRSDTNYMAGNGFTLKHDRLIDRQLGGNSGDALVAGHKKDLIISKHVQGRTSLDFYGLFDRNGRPIQGAHGDAHENTYVDYSHGVRYVSQQVIVNGRPMRYDEVLKDPRYAGLLSDEGSFDPRYAYKRPHDPRYNAIA